MAPGNWMRKGRGLPEANHPRRSLSLVRTDPDLTLTPLPSPLCGAPVPSRQLNSHHSRVCRAASAEMLALKMRTPPPESTSIVPWRLSNVARTARASVFQRARATHMSRKLSYA